MWGFLASISSAPMPVPVFPTYVGIPFLNWYHKWCHFLVSNYHEKGDKKKTLAKFFLGKGLTECGRLDLNQHNVSATSTSS